jgi:hypothetical protein
LLLMLRQIATAFMPLAIALCHKLSKRILTGIAIKQRFWCSGLVSSWWACWPWIWISSWPSSRSWDKGTAVPLINRESGRRADDAAK